MFSRLRESCLDDEEFAELQQFMLLHPEAGRVVPGSGGLRKLRWAREGTGKRGGLRVIYFVRYRPNQFWLLTLYTKSRVGSIPAHILRELRRELENV